MEKEWLKEPNRKEFTYKGYHCFIQRHMHLGHLCGYVDLPKLSQFYGVDYYKIVNIDVHGDLTYSNWSDDKKTAWRIGFDCAHLDDFSPYGMFDQSGTVYRNITFVENEIKRIVGQIIKLEMEENYD